MVDVYYGPPPTNLSVSVSGSLVFLGWTAPSNPSGLASYIIEAGSSPGAANLAAFDTGSVTTDYGARDVGLGTYYIRVRARFRGGASSPSNEVAATVLGGGGCALPGPPGSLSGSASGSTVDLSWGAAANGVSFVIEAGSSSGAANLANFDTNSSATSYRATGVGAGTYYIRVRGKNACGVGPSTSDARVVVGGTTPTPAPCTGQGTLSVTGDQGFFYLNGTYVGQGLFVRDLNPNFYVLTEIQPSDGRTCKEQQVRVDSCKTTIVRWDFYCR